jgi:hypothetical protein
MNKKLVVFVIISIFLLTALPKSVNANDGKGTLAFNYKCHSLYVSGTFLICAPFLMHWLPLKFLIAPSLNVNSGDRAEYINKTVLGGSIGLDKDGDGRFDDGIYTFPGQNETGEIVGIQVTGSYAKWYEIPKLEARTGYFRWNIKQVQGIIHSTYDKLVRVTIWIDTD